MPSTGLHKIEQTRSSYSTGADGDFIIGVDWNSFGDVSDPGVWSQIYDEGSQVLENIANIRVPVIAAIEGRAYIHSDYALLANVIVAAEGSSFQDVRPFRRRCDARPRNLLRRGVIALEQDERRRSCSTRGRCQLLPHMNGESWQKSCRTGQALKSGAGTGRAVLEGSGSDAPRHAHPLHSAIEGADCARSWIRAVV